LLGWQPIEHIGNKFLQCRTSGIQSSPPGGNAGPPENRKNRGARRRHVLRPLRATICLKHLILASGRNCSPGPNGEGRR
jgi:hypothetical protein